MNVINRAPVILPPADSSVLDTRVHDRARQEVPAIQDEVAYHGDHPHLRILPQEHISMPLSRSLLDPVIDPKVPHCQIEKIAKKIFDRYNLTERQFAHQLPEEHALKVKVLAYDAEKIYHTIKKWTTIGAIGGGVLAEGAYMLATRDPNLWNHFKATVAGVVTGSIVGGFAGRFFATRTLRQETYITLEIPTIYSEWQKGMTQETYELYRAAYKNYVHNDIGIEEFICNITLDLPLIPVKAHDGRYYEKVAIEKWFDEREKERNELREKKQELEQEISSLLRSLSPIHAIKKNLADHVNHPDYIQKMKQDLIDNPNYFQKLKGNVVYDSYSEKWFDEKEKERNQLRGKKQLLEEKVFDLLTSLSPIRALKDDANKPPHIQKMKKDLLDDSDYFQKLKEGLIYNPDYVQNMIKKLRVLVLEKRIDPNADPLLKEILSKEYNHFIQIHQQVDNQLTVKLMSDLLQLGATNQQINEYVILMQNHFKLKEINEKDQVIEEKDQEIAFLRQQLNSRQVSVTSI